MPTPLDKLRLSPDWRLAVMIGVFDGVHIGHQELIREVIEIDSSHPDMHSAALTFDPHPAALFARSGPPLLLGTLEERSALLSAHGIEQVILAPFDRQFADQSADAFVRSVIVDRLRAAAVVVGEDFRYGRDRMGDVKSLEIAGIKHGFSVTAVPQVYADGNTPVRSTEIRRLIALGQVDRAGALLGRPYLLCGVVVHGRQLGRTLGFPTANLLWDATVIAPGPGVYAGAVHIGGERHRAAISVGDNPTVAPEGTVLPWTVEAFILDGFDRDIYGLPVCFEFHSNLRGMEKFASINALVTQMQADVQEVIRRSG